MRSLIEKYKGLSLIAKASIWFLVCSFMQKGISVITTPIYTRMMTTSEYGTFNVFTSWEYILNIFVSLCLSAGVYQQGLVKFEKDTKRFSSAMQGLTVFIVLIWTGIYFIFHGYINKILGFNTVYMLSMIFIIWTNNVYAFWANEQKVNYKYKRLIIITVLSSILNPLLSILMIKYMNDKVLARILGLVFIASIFYVFMFFCQIIAGKKLFDKYYWKYALAYNLPLIPHYLSQTVLSSSDRIMIEKMINSQTAGIYSLAYSIALIMTLFNNALMQTISPWMYKKIKENDMKSIKKVSMFSLVLIALVNLALISLAPEAVSIFAPKEYHEAIYIIPPVAMSVFFMYMYDLFAKFEFYYEKTKMISIATLIGAISNVILNFIFIKLFGYVAAGYTTLICYILYALFHYLGMRYVCKREINECHPYNYKEILFLSVLFLVLGFSFLFLYNFKLIRYLFIIVLLFLMVFCKSKIKSIFVDLKK